MFKFLLISALLFFLGYGIVSFFYDKTGRSRKKQQSPPKRNKENMENRVNKKFSQNIGEYVNYEEVKDSDEK